MGSPTILSQAREDGFKAEHQKWSYISLEDFKANGIGSYLSYAWVWILCIISVLVYAADTFTAVNLLAFNRWSAQFQPTIPLSIAKWIFAACILFSWLLCGFEWFVAWRTMRKNSVSKDYLDPLAVTIQSLRVFGKEDRGFQRFMVFAELTKSRKGADYIALFVYFQFKGAVRILLAEGPRQAVNALILFSLMFQHLNGKDAGSDISQFWLNMKTLAADHRDQAVILWSMVFTFVIWLVSFLSLLASCLLYISFLWHYIPSRDGSLSKYCRRKIEKRLAKIVSAKVELALKQQRDKARKEQEKEFAKAGIAFPKPARAPTLPSIFNKDDDASSISTTLTRSDTHSTAAPFRPPIRTGSQDSNVAPSLFSEPTLPNIGEESPRPAAPIRTFTDASTTSLSSTASDRPLLPSQASFGYTGKPMPRPAPSNINRRPLAPSRQASFGPTYLPDRAATASPSMMRGPLPTLDRAPSFATQSSVRHPPPRSATTDPYGAPAAAYQRDAAFQCQRQMSASTDSLMNQSAGPRLTRQDSAQTYQRPLPSQTRLPTHPTNAAYTTPTYQPLFQSPSTHQDAINNTAFQQPLSAARESPRQQTPQPPVLRRVGTAPLPDVPHAASSVGDYGETVIDTYSRGWGERQPGTCNDYRPPPSNLLPRRPGTAGPRMH